MGAKEGIRTIFYKSTFDKIIFESFLIQTSLEPMLMPKNVKITIQNKVIYNNQNRRFHLHYVTSPR